MDYYQNLAKELPPEENDKLAVKAKDDKECRDKLIIHNTRLVKYFADKLSFQTFLTFDDLFQEGILGLIKAVDKYKPERGSKFSTYASWWIKQYITRAIGDTERTVRIPIWMLQQISDLEKIKKRVFKERNRIPSIKELANEMNTTSDKIRKIIKASEEVTSLNSQRAGQDGDITLLDMVADEGPTPDEIAEANVFIEQFIQEFKKQLKPLEIDSIIMYYGLNEEGKCHTLQQIADKYNCSNDNVRQYKEKALRKVRESLFIKELMEEVEEETNYYPNVNYTRVGLSGGMPSSPVERLAMKREALLEKKLKYLKED